MITGTRPRLPLFPLPDVVHFPRTALRLHVFEPRYRQLVRDLEAQEEQVRWIGMVLLKPGPELGFGRPPEVFPEGTAGRLLEVEPLPDGRSNIVLQGEFRFAIEREIPDLRHALPPGVGPADSRRSRWTSPTPAWSRCEARSSRWRRS